MFLNYGLVKDFGKKFLIVKGVFFSSVITFDPKSFALPANFVNYLGFFKIELLFIITDFKFVARNNY